MNDAERDRLWDEYKYRHTHVWSLVFRLTLAVVAISIVPYTQPRVASTVQEGILLLPAVAVLLTAIAAFQVHREIKILSWLKRKHRALQGSSAAMKKSRFQSAILVYILGLLLLALANGFVVERSWLPSLQDRTALEACPSNAPPPAAVERRS